ncbi:MAG: PilN domain-containing protein [Desulfobacterales bacterium]|nr:PilN domain-containing protein [Desulfobacterales bacterium]
MQILRKQTSNITRAAKKASQATVRIRDIQKKNDLLRKFVQDKPFFLSLLRDVSQAISTESRVDNLSISHTGTISLQGTSKDEILVTSIVKKMEESPMINDCQLYGIEKDSGNHLFKFSIEAGSDQWQRFFENGGGE